MSPVRNCASKESEKDISNGVRGRFIFCQKLGPFLKTLLIIFIICYVSFSFAAGGKPRKYRPHLVGNCETGERFAPSLENLFLPYYGR